MFDISWTEFLLIGVVALIVIGPKELPAVMRTMGQWTRKVRSMAADFQNQFHEAMREAEMTDLKKEVDDLAQGIKNYDPLKSARSEVETFGKSFETSWDEKPATPAITAGPGEVPAEAGHVQVEPESSVEAIPAPAADFPLGQAAAELGDKNLVGAATGPVVAEAVDQAAFEFSPPAADTPKVAQDDAVAAATGPVAPEAAETAPEPDGAGRSG